MGVPSLSLTELLDRVSSVHEDSEDLIYTVTWNVWPELDVVAITDEDQAFRSRLVNLAHLRAFEQIALILCDRALPGWQIDLSIDRKWTACGLSKVFNTKTLEPDFTARAATPALALLRALLKALIIAAEPADVG